MKDRRSLMEGLTGGADRTVEEQFVFAGKPKEEQATQTEGPTTAPEVVTGKEHPAHSIGRVPLTTRVRSDFAAALKRASLQRQLDGVFPNTLQDIL